MLETVTATDKNGSELPLTDQGGGKFTFTMPASQIEVKATFVEDNSVLSFFYDVPNDAYYYEAVKWAQEKGVTGGIGNNLFGPNQPCTRAQIVTFLYRYMQSQGKGFTGNWMFQLPFTDVPEWCYEAVAWCYMEKVTDGTTATTFSPNDNCTRAQIVTMLQRLLAD